MKKACVWLMVLVMLLMGASSAMAASDSLFERVELLLEEGDDSLSYDGLGLPVGMDDMNVADGVVMVELEAGTGTIQASCGGERWIWDFLEGRDIANTLLVLCARWEELTDGTGEDLVVKSYVNTRSNGDFFMMTTAEEAQSFLDALLGASGQ